MQIQLNPDNAKFVAVAAADSYCTPNQIVNDIISVYQTAQAMVPIIPPPTDADPDDRDFIDEWDPHYPEA
jgi:hypothetical protein